MNDYQMSTKLLLPEQKCIRTGRAALVNGKQPELLFSIQLTRHWPGRRRGFVNVFDVDESGKIRGPKPPASGLYYLVGPATMNRLRTRK